MRRLLPTIFLVAITPTVTIGQTPEPERWEINFTLGPCEGFAVGGMTTLHGSELGRYLVGDLEAEGQCTGEFADSTFDVSSGIVTAVEHAQDDELIINSEEVDGFLRFVSQGKTPLGRRTGKVYMCFYPDGATWEAWQSLMELGEWFDAYEQLTAEQQASVASQAGLMGYSIGMHCLEGTFSLRVR